MPPAGRGGHADCNSAIAQILPRDTLHAARIDLAPVPLPADITPPTILNVA